MKITDVRQTPSIKILAALANPSLFPDDEVFTNSECAEIIGITVNSMRNFLDKNPEHYVSVGQVRHVGNPKALKALRKAMNTWK